MWQSLAKFVIKNRIILLAALLLSTCVMGYFASKVKLSYEFSRAIPSDDPKYLDYAAFKNKFGDDGNLLVAAVGTEKLFTVRVFTDYQQLAADLKKIKGVEDILSIPGAMNLVKDSVTEKLDAVKIFPESISTQGQLDSAMAIFNQLPFYNMRLYNNETHSYLMAVRINKDVLATKERTKVIGAITDALARFEKTTGTETHVSGLPLIRTAVADRIQKEMKIFLLASLGLSVLILLLFFRSPATTLLSLAVVLIGVIWTVATIVLCGYQITLLTALIPSLVVVIGIPNCIYFINKYHASYIKDAGNPSPADRKNNALVAMVSKMGVVTLFCNITAAIGFAVFALTKSAILKEFGVVAGISIMVIFVVSFILLPAMLSILPAPKPGQLKYLKNKAIESVLNMFERWAFIYRKQVLLTTLVIVLLAIGGIMRLRTVAYIVDDLPKKDRIYTDLKYFEQNFKGVMPLEILIDSRSTNGILKSTFDIKKVDYFQDSILAGSGDIGKPLSVVDAIKFTYQGLSGGNDSAFSLPLVNPMLSLHSSLKEIKRKKAENNLQPKDSAMLKMVGSFVDSTERYLRISVSMKDIGTERLPVLLDSLRQRTDKLFDSSYKVTFTGTSITFLEGSKFIINGLKQSILWAFLLIALCMLFLFRSVRILLCSLIPNIIPLLITAGIMGWVGVPLKPSTVLIFSVALGIAIDITIRFLVNYKQVLPEHDHDVAISVKNTIHQTGLSIIYTSLVLTAGFIIFCASSFGGTFALGWLTSITLFTGTITNLVLLPVLLLIFQKKSSSAGKR